MLQDAIGAAVHNGAQTHTQLFLTQKKYSCTYNAII